MYEKDCNCIISCNGVVGITAFDWSTSSVLLFTDILALLTRGLCVSILMVLMCSQTLGMHRTLFDAGSPDIPSFACRDTHGRLGWYGERRCREFSIHVQLDVLACVSMCTRQYSGAVLPSTVHTLCDKRFIICR
jgi:hypothetical protein